ncbi:uncharacterized protein LOC110246908 [Exaiptasia diaphana]|uniref:Uncharacterized protein n=1 Tax=Exaiptasia diaphana TaxID=2652724 RepID=A0A913XTJ8_EXADI|nr:uncharacterized protein LOC110246908 [Exaiptasia diaphana]
MLVDRRASCVNQCKEKLINVFINENVALKKTVEVPLRKTPRICNSRKDIISQATKVELRSRFASKSNTVELYQFDPNFFSVENIWCRYPGCKQSRLRQVGSKKEDLYLCPGHMRDLEDKLIKMFKLKGVDVPMDESHEELKDYTSLIGILERACQSHTIKSAFSERSPMIREVCLNMRNVLIIINALLNPDPDNTTVSLKFILQLVLKLLKDDSINDVDLEKLVAHLRAVIEEIFQAFGIIYLWIERNKFGLSAGTRLGVGIGGFLGMAGIIGGPVTFGITTMAGAVFGGFIGSGLYDLLAKEERDNSVDELNEIIRRYQEFAKTMDSTHSTAVYVVSGREDGELNFHVVCY